MKRYIGYRPYAHQKAIHDYITEVGPKAGKIICVKAKRQVGKSLLIEQELLRHAINYRRSVNICLSITFANCKKIYQELVTSIRKSGVIAYINSQQMEITLINGSSILFKSAAQGEQLRGYTVKNGGILCIDEAAYIKDEIFSIIAPWTNVFNANILMVSTPRLKQGFFYNYFIEGKNGTSTKVKSFDLNDFDTSFLISADTLETYKKIMPPSQFMSEYLGMFVDDLGGVFDITKDIWVKLTQKGWGNIRDIQYNTQFADYTELFIGIDWSAGTGGDYTAIVAFDASGHQRYLQYINNLSPTQQLDWLCDVILNKLQTNKIKKIVCETNSIGNVYIDMLKKRLRNLPIETFTTTNESKRDIIEYLISRISDEKIKLFYNEELFRQFSMYEVEITPSGKITYNGAAGTHDDIVMATAFAFKAIHDLERNANYSIGWRKDKNRNPSLHERYN